MATENIGRSALKVYKYYKKHYDDINALFAMTGLDASSSQPVTAEKLPDDLLSLMDKADQSLAALHQFTTNVDDLATINAQDLKTKRPDMCTALKNYKKDLDALFSAIQAVRAKAPKPKKKASGKARTKKF